MKKLILIASIIVGCLSVKAQINKDTVGLNLPFTDGQLLYTGIVSLQGKSKIDLYKNAQQWFVDYFNSSKSVIQNQDKDDGLIIGKGIIKFNSPIGLGMVMPFGDNITVKIECKDGKYRYTFYDVSISYYYNGTTDFLVDYIMAKLLGNKTRWGWSKKNAKAIMVNSDDQIKKAIISLNAAMTKTATDF